MDDLSSLIAGFKVALSWHNIGFMAVGVILGIIVGVLPGLGGPNGVAILLPLTFGMDPTSAIILLSSIYWGALFGGAITSILFNIPGEAWSVATTFDGYPMAVQGKAAEALTAAFTASFIGALSGVVLITFVAPLVAQFALRFGPAEFFAVFLLTFCSFIGMGRENRARDASSPRRCRCTRRPACCPRCPGAREPPAPCPRCGRRRPSRPRCRRRPSSS